MVSDSKSQKVSRGPEIPDQELSTVAKLVDETLTHGFRWLYFPRKLENRFERDTGAARVRQMIIAGLLAILLYDLFLFSDYTMIPEIFSTALALRLGLITPIVILVIVAQYYWRSPVLREGLGAVAIVSGSVGLIYLIFVSRHANAAYYVNGLILSTMFGNILLRLRFFYAATASLFVVVLYAVVAPAAPHLVPTAITNNIISLSATAMLTLFANYTLEREHRRSYLLRLRDHMRRDVLTAHNIRLTELINIDPLTGIANRRELDDFLDHLQQGPRPDMLAIVMFDIDRFKHFNDLYGHPAGDKCLRRVASALQASLRSSIDLVARFGGEEFAVVLPGSDIQAAHQVAERMRQAVVDLAIPHDESSVANVVTVSGGVAAANPNTGVQAILTAADAALYRAKSAGRNCVQ